MSDDLKSALTQLLEKTDAILKIQRQQDARLAQLERDVAEVKTKQAVLMARLDEQSHITGALIPRMAVYE